MKTPFPMTDPWDDGILTYMETSVYQQTPTKCGQIYHNPPQKKIRKLSPENQTRVVTN